MKITRHLPLCFTFLASFVLLTGCGAGTAAVAGAGGGETTTTPAPTVGTSLKVTNNAGTARPVISPATVRFELTSASVVRLSFAIASGPGVQPPDSDFTPLTLVGPAVGEAGANAFKWDFKFDLGDERYRNNIVIRLDVEGEFSPGDLRDVEVGNDAPVALANLSLPAGVGGEDPSGDIDVQFRLSDEARDQVDIKVEYDVVGDIPDSGYQIARQAGLSPTVPTPEFAFADFAPSVQLVPLTFRWESTFQGDANDPNLLPQIFETEREVQFRITITEQLIADDLSQAERILNTGSFRVDNNTPPVATVTEGAFLGGTKDRGNIPIPFIIVDPTADEVGIVVQWQVKSAASNNNAKLEAFPALPTDLADLSDLLTNRARGAERRALQIAKEAPLEFNGRVGSLASSVLPALKDNEVRLPELSSNALALEFHGLVGRTLEIMRSTSIVTTLDWNANPLTAPVASLVLGDGSTALVLDDVGGSWQILEVDLETGSVLTGAGSLSSSGSGSPIALAMDPMEDNLFVATSSEIVRVDLAGGAVVNSVGHGFGVALRGIAPISANLVVATGNDQLRRFDLASDTSRLLLDGLSEPWGVVVDPLEEDTVLVAERGLDRIVSISLDELVPLPIAAEPDDDLIAAGSLPFPSPRNIAFDPNGSRLLVICDDGVSAGSLRALNFRGSFEDGPSSIGRGAPLVSEIESELNDPEAGLATGVDRIRLLTSPSMNELAISGGASQRRTIVDNESGDPSVSYDRAKQVVTLATDFDPAPPKGAKWRIAVPVKPTSSSDGRSFTFIWDSSDVPDATEVLVRVLPIDTDLGIAQIGSGFRSFRTNFEAEEILLSAQANFPDTVLTADFDGDGDLDIATANSEDTLNVFAGSNFEPNGSIMIVNQVEPGVFRKSNPIHLPDGMYPLSMFAADLNDDGLIDLVTANRDDNSTSGTLTIFFQLSSLGAFSLAPEVLLAGVAPESVVAADLDGDGDMDLVCADRASDELIVFIQEPAGMFTADSKTLPTGLSPSEVVAADLDGDGDIDLASGDSLGNTLTVYFQTSPGMFTLDPNSPYATGVEPASVIAVDLNGDGAQDLVAANQDENTLTVFLQQEAGVFVDTMSPVPTGGGLDSVLAGDFDGDGDMDLVSVDSSGDSLTLIFQTSPGNFVKAAEKIPVGDRPRSVAAGDLDGDGDIDLVSANAGPDSISVLMNASGGAFVPSELSLKNVVKPEDVIGADMNGDGAVDLVITSSNEDRLTILSQSSPGNFVFGAELDFAKNSTPISIAAADLNGDGLQDLVTSHGALDDPGPNDSRMLTIIYQEADGSFDVKAAEQANTLDTLKPAGRVLAVDLNDDGALDLVAVNGEGPTGTQGEVVVGSLVGFIQSGGEFPLTPSFQLDDVIDPRGLAAADLNGDGMLDLATTSATDNRLILFFQEADGSFTLDAQTHMTLGKPNQVVAADLDGDGDVDLATADSLNGRLSVFFQSTPGSFASIFDLTLDAGDDCEHVVAIDLDDDGDIDLVSADAKGETFALDGLGSLTVFYQVGPGVFSPLGKKLVTGRDAVSLFAADLDGDGDVDLGNLNLIDKTITIMVNGK